MPEGTFHAPPQRLRWLSDIVLDAVEDPAGPLAVLDIGCGTGDQIFDLAPRLPQARFTGVDIAPPNIAIAEARRAGHTTPDRFAFVRGDYLSFDAPARFDVVIHYSFLQFVSAEAHDVARRLASQTLTNGVLINVMPYRCGYNAALGSVRRAFRAIRSPATDKLFLLAARAVHGRSYDPVMLAERVEYAYEPVVRYEEELAQALEAQGFRTLRRTPIAHVSPAQMKHACRVMRIGDGSGAGRER